MIPVRLEDLTRDYFETALKRKLGDDLRVVCADVRPAFPVKLGFLATHIKATVVVADKKNRKSLMSLFMKLVPLEDGFFMDFLTSERFDVREVIFFDEIATAVEDYLAKRCDWHLPIPRLAFSDYTTEDSRSILILHDASEDGFVPKTLSVGWDLPHVLVGIRCLAKFHAAGMSYMVANGLDNQTMEERHPKLRFNPLGFTGTLDFRRLCLENLQADFAEHDGGRGDDEDELVGVLESMKSRDVDDIMKVYKTGLSGPFVGIAHKDCWNNNFMFKYDVATGEPLDAMLCDWQWANISNVTVDLASLLYTSVDTDLRRKCMDYLLKEYYRVLSHVLKYLDTPLPAVEGDFEHFREAFYGPGIAAAFDLMRVLRIPFSKSDAEFEGSPIMRRMIAAFRDMLRVKVAMKTW